jgi:hypothetical protein
MAEAEYNKKYTTTYKAGENIYVTFEWQRLHYTDKFYLWDTSIGTDAEPILKEYDYNTFKFTDTDDIVYITDMKVIGSGEAYESVYDYKLKDTTDPYYDEYMTGPYYEEYGEASISYGTCIFTGILRPMIANTHNYVCCIDEITVSEGITNLGNILNKLMQSSRAREYTVIAKYMKLPKTLQRTGSINYVFVNQEYEQLCAFYTYNMVGTSNRIAYEIDIDCTSLQYIGRQTFIEGVNIIEDFHCDVLEIASEAFYNYNAIVNIDLGTNIEYVGSSAFTKCENLISINDGNFFDCICVNRIFSGCNKIEFITLGNNIIHHGIEYGDNVYTETTLSFI